MLENFKILKNKASAHKKIKKFKKSYKNYLAKISTISKTTPVKKIFLRLIPKTNQTHQLMMKMNNFPRLELRYFFDNF